MYSTVQFSSILHKTHLEMQIYLNPLKQAMQANGNLENGGICLLPAALNPKQRHKSVQQK